MSFVLERRGVRTTDTGDAVAQVASTEGLDQAEVAGEQRMLPVGKLS